MEHSKNIVLLAIAICILLISLFWSHQSDKYSVTKIIELDSVRRSVLETGPAIQKARILCEEIVNSYRLALAERVNPRFRQELPLWQDKKISAKFVFSSMAESLLYLFPAEDNILYADLVHVPVQLALMHDLIKLDTPMLAVDRESLHIESSHKALKEYEGMPGAFGTKGVAMRLLGPEDSTLKLTDSLKLVTFLEKYSIFGFYKPRIVISNTADWYKERFGGVASFELRLKGPLLISGEKDFSWVSEEGKTLGRAMAEADISELLIKSEFFRQSLAEPKLQPLTDAILKKKARAEKDPDFSYPLWQQEMDIKELRVVAEPFNIAASYVDRLLGERPAFSVGFLLWWFENAWDFMWQWILINMASLVLLIPFYTARNQLPSPFKAFLMKFAIGAVTAMNAGWVWVVRPSTVTGLYLLIPVMLWVLSLYLSFLIGNSKSTSATGSSV